MLEREIHSPCRRARVEHDIEPKIFHGGVEVFFDDAVQTVDFVDEQNVVFLQACEKPRKIACLFENGPARNVDVHAHFFRDDARKRRLAESRRARKKAMVERIAAALCRSDGDGKTFLDVVLACKFA